MTQLRCTIWLFLILVALMASGGPTANSSTTKSGVQEGKYRLVVTVTSADRNEPVEGASVTVMYMYDPAFKPIRIDTQTTGQDGKAWVIPGVLGGIIKVQPKPGARFEITVTHPDYIGAYRPVPIRSDTKAGDIPVNVALRRKSGGKVVAVTLTAAGEGSPIYNANVKLKGTISPTLFSGTTDSNGRALINVTEADNYEVTITHTGFESINQTLPVKMYDEQREYNLNLQMKRTAEDERILRVSVTGKDKQGKTGPVRYADVTLPDGQTKTTDYEGQVQFRHKLPPGEDIKVEVEATYFKSGSGNFTVGVRKASMDTVRIYLEREDEGVGCGIGRVWNDVESGHSMKWTRIGASNQFLVEATINGKEFTAKQDIFIAGNKVTINRFEASDGNTCNFEGTINGGSASGTYTCTKYKPSSGWSATISCN